MHDNKTLGRDEHKQTVPLLEFESGNKVDVSERVNPVPETTEQVAKGGDQDVYKALISLVTYMYST